MAKLSIVAGATSQSINVFIQDSSSTTGAGLSGLVWNSTNLVAYYSFTGTNAGSVQITLATLAAANSAYSSGGFKEIDATNMKGWYRLDLPNAALATGKGREVSIHIGGAVTNMAPCPIDIELTGWDNQDAVHGGMSALPNAAAAASGGLIINGSNSGTVTIGDGLVVNRSTSNSDAVQFNGSGSGNGFTIAAGAGATTTAGGIGLKISGGAGGTTGAPGAGIQVVGGVAGSTSGNAAPALKLTGGAAAAGTGTGAEAINATGGAASTTAAGGNGLTLTGGVAATGFAGGIGANISGGAASTTGAGGSGVVIAGAGGGTTGASGIGLSITGGAAGSTSGNASQAVKLVGGAAAAGTGTGAEAIIGTGGAASSTAAGGNGLTIAGGVAATGFSGGIGTSISGGAASTTGAGGIGLKIVGADGGSTAAGQHGISIQSGASGTTSGVAGNGINVVAGNATAGSGTAGIGINLTGGTATSTGTAGVGLNVTGGAGAASANGAASGVTFAGGGTNTVASTADALKLTGTSTGHGLDCQGGTGATGNGINAVSNATNGSGITATKTGSGKDFNAQSTNSLQVNVTQYNSQTAQTDANNLPKVDLEDWSGSAVAATNTAGVPVVDTRELVRQGTAQGTGNSTTAIKLDSGANATDNYYKTALIQIISGTGAPQWGICTGYVGSTKIATIAPAWPTAPDATSVFQIFPAQADTETIKGTASAGAAGYVGPDWGNVNAQTSTVGLTNTTISTSQVAASVTAGVTVSTNNDKTGYSLAASGLDAISVSDPGGVSSMTTLPKMLVALWRRAFKKSTLTASQLKTYADDDATVNTTQATSDDGTTQTLGHST